MPTRHSFVAMMHLHRQAFFLLSWAGIIANTAFAQDVNAGFNVYTAVQVMVNKAGQSWEWGTAAQALLELYNPELSVFASNPFPGGTVPKPGSSTVALTYARQFINRDSQVFVDNAAVGDPASLGVSAILLGQQDRAYIDASNRQADYLLKIAPKWSNGAISHRPDVAELWADNMAMSFPFLAYLAVQNNDVGLMTETVRQCGLYRDVLKTSASSSWRHIIGPQSQDTGLWSTGNAWAGYGMVRVLHTLQKWPGSSSLTSQAGQLKTWIKEILDGAISSSTENGLLRNYLGDSSWFGEISGTALLSAVAYRMAVNDPGMFPQSYINWADANRQALARTQNSGGVFSPAVNPYNWLDRTKFTAGSPEGQAFAVHLYTAYRDCVAAGVCQRPTAPSVTTVSNPGIGPTNIMQMLDPVLTYAPMPDPTGTICGVPQSCDTDNCAGTFTGLTKYPVCTGGFRKGCRCTITATTCGARQSCDLNGCAGQFNGLVKYAQCTGNFEGCPCTATANTCGPHQSCDLNGCAGKFNGLAKYPQCSGNFEGCECTITSNTCGTHQSCDLNGCAGQFNGLVKYAQCTGNFEGCECTATANTCGNHQSCDLNGCNGQFLGLQKFAQCTGNFEGCECTATRQTCGTRQSCDLNGCAGRFNNGIAVYPQCSGNFQGCECNATPSACGTPQSCGLNGCAGRFDLGNGKAYCSANFVGCECQATPATCGTPQDCDKGNCDGRFNGLTPVATCSNFFKGCVCKATAATCGTAQSCDLNGCAGGFDINGVPRCQGNFEGCQCLRTSNTCGTPQNCNLNGCAGTFDSNSNTARCRGNFAGCVCKPVSSTCGSTASCSANGCNGGLDGSSGQWLCTVNRRGCPCTPDPIWIPPPPPPVKVTAIVLLALSQQVQGIDNHWEFWWDIFDANGIFTGNFCYIPSIRSYNGNGATQPYPTGLPAFDVGGFTGCVYSGSVRSPGSIRCSGGGNGSGGASGTCDASDNGFEDCGYGVGLHRTLYCRIDSY